MCHGIQLSLWSIKIWMDATAAVHDRLEHKRSLADLEQSITASVFLYVNSDGAGPCGKINHTDSCLISCRFQMLVQK